MAKFVVLVNWTEKGVSDASETRERAQNVGQLAEQMGGRMDLLLWTLGRHDLVAVLDFPDDETYAAFALKVGGIGAVRTESLRAFTAEEVGGIISKLG